MKIIYGTSNKEKIEQVKSLIKLENADIEIISLKDINFNEDIEENGTTFEENSLIKAKVIKDFCKKNNINNIIITDDAGLCVDALNGEPGVHSARYAGDHASQEKSIEKLLNNMKDVDEPNRTAQFVCVLTAILENGEMIVCRGETKGKIAKKAGPMGNLTYMPVFIPEQYDRVMNELSEEELKVTHREKAFLEMIKKLKKYSK